MPFEVIKVRGVFTVQQRSSDSQFVLSLSSVSPLSLPLCSQEVPLCIKTPFEHWSAASCKSASPLPLCMSTLTMVWYYTESSHGSIMHTPSIFLFFFSNNDVSPDPSDKYVCFELCRGHRGSSSLFQSTRGTLNLWVLFIRVINDEWNLSQKWHIISLKSMTVTKSLSSLIVAPVCLAWYSQAGTPSTKFIVRTPRANI